MTTTKVYPAVEVSHLMTSSGYECPILEADFINAQAFLGTTDETIESTILKVDWSKPQDPKTLSEYDARSNTITVYTERLAQRLGRTAGPLRHNWGPALKRSKFNAALSSLFAYEAYIQAGESIAWEIRQREDGEDYPLPDLPSLAAEAEAFRRSRNGFCLFEGVVELEWAQSDGPYLELYGGHVLLTGQRSEQLPV